MAENDLLGSIDFQQGPSGAVVDNSPSQALEALSNIFVQHRQSKIAEELQENILQVNEEFLEGDLSDFEREALDSTANNVAKLRRAASQGAMSQMAYQTRVNQVVSAQVAKYPRLEAPLRRMAGDLASSDPRVAAKFAAQEAQAADAQEILDNLEEIAKNNGIPERLRVNNPQRYYERAAELSVDVANVQAEKLEAELQTALATQETAPIQALAARNKRSLARAAPSIIRLGASQIGQIAQEFQSISTADEAARLQPEVVEQQIRQIITSVRNDMAELAPFVEQAEYNKYGLAELEAYADGIVAELRDPNTTLDRLAAFDDLAIRSLIASDPRLTDSKRSVAIMRDVLGGEPDSATLLAGLVNDTVANDVANVINSGAYNTAEADIDTVSAIPEDPRESNTDVNLSRRGYARQAKRFLDHDNPELVINAVRQQVNANYRSSRHKWHPDAMAEYFSLMGDDRFVKKFASLDELEQNKFLVNFMPFKTGFVEVVRDRIAEQINSSQDLNVEIRGSSVVVTRELRAGRANVQTVEDPRLSSWLTSFVRAERLRVGNVELDEEFYTAVLRENFGGLLGE